MSYNNRESLIYKTKRQFWLLPYGMHLLLSYHTLQELYKLLLMLHPYMKSSRDTHMHMYITCHLVLMPFDLYCVLKKWTTQECKLNQWVSLSSFK